jgi:hypothetical protein
LIRRFPSNYTKKLFGSLLNQNQVQKAMSASEAEGQRDEYAFEKGEMEKVYIPAESVGAPVHLTPDVEDRLRKQAEKIGKTPSELATAILDNELRLMESL